MTQDLSTPQRHYDIDWIRTFALAWLILHHVAVSFQPWAANVLIIKNGESLVGIWLFMFIVSIWRIPILFVISGIAMFYAMQRQRNVLWDRFVRIFIPLVFGYYFVCPIFLYYSISFNSQDLQLFDSSFFRQLPFNAEAVYQRGARYLPNFGHLWFLVNILVYTVCFVPVFWLMRKYSTSKIWDGLVYVLERPFGFLVIAIPFVLEGWIIDPVVYSLYGRSAHGIVLGALCFFAGFTYAFLGDRFWQAAQKHKEHALLIAMLICIPRSIWIWIPNYLVALESFCWIFGVLGYGAAYLNKPSDKIVFWSRAVYPIYILHFPVQHAIAYYLFGLELPAILKFVLLLSGTYLGCFVIYYYILRNLGWGCIFFGMKRVIAAPSASAGEKPTEVEAG